MFFDCGGGSVQKYTGSFFTRCKYKIQNENNHIVFPNSADYFQTICHVWVWYGYDCVVERTKHVYTCAPISVFYIQVIIILGTRRCVCDMFPYFAVDSREPTVPLRPLPFSSGGISVGISGGAFAFSQMFYYILRHMQ